MKKIKILIFMVIFFLGTLGIQLNALNVIYGETGKKVSGKTSTIKGSEETKTGNNILENWLTSKTYYYVLFVFKVDLNKKYILTVEADLPKKVDDDQRSIVFNGPSANLTTFGSLNYGVGKTDPIYGCTKDMQRFYLSFDPKSPSNYLVVEFDSRYEPEMNVNMILEETELSKEDVEKPSTPPNCKKAYFWGSSFENLYLEGEIKKEENTKEETYNNLNLDDWNIYGTAKISDDSYDKWLIIGDNIGYDPSDSDNDKNLWNQFADPNSTSYDYDAIVSKKSFIPPIKFYFHGYLGTSYKGYNEAGLAYSNENFTGEPGGGLPIGTKLAYFTLHWENPDVLETGYYNSSTGNQQNYKESFFYGMKDNLSSDNNVWGEFEIDWDGKVVKFYRNGQLIREENLLYEQGKKVKVFFRNYENPFGIMSYKIEGSKGESTIEDNDTENKKEFKPASSYDPTTNILHVYNISFNGHYYSVDFKIIKSFPTIEFTISNYSELSSPNSEYEVSTFDTNKKILTIPSLEYNGKKYSLELTYDVFSFKLTNIKPLNNY